MSRLASLFRETVSDARPDGQLLAAFLTERDEAAFAELVRRHGPLVWGVCRRALPDYADAEDAFQAAFLVLVRRAHRLTASPTVGPWLFRVAAWTARNLRRKNARQLARRSAMPGAVLDPHSLHEPTFELDDLLLALPDRARAAVVLCQLQGLSHREAGDRLGCPEGTVASLVSRGLAKLREKFAVPLSVLAGVTVPATLSSATVRSAVAFHLTLPAASPAVVALTEGVLRMFWVKKLTTAVAVGMVLVAGIGTVIGVRQTAQATAVDPATPGDQAETRAMLQKLSANQDQLRKDVERLTLQLDRVTQELATERKRDRLVTGGTIVTNGPPAGPSLTVSVKSGTRPGFAIVERGADGRDTWEVTFRPDGTGDAAAMRAYLTRARRDPSGPKSVQIKADRDAPAAHVRVAVQVVRDAGFKGDQASGFVTDPGSSTPSLDPVTSPAPKAREYNLGDPFVADSNRIDANTTAVAMVVGSQVRVNLGERVVQVLPGSSIVLVAGEGRDAKEILLHGFKVGTTDVIVTTADKQTHTLRVTVTEAENLQKK